MAAKRASARTSDHSGRLLNADGDEIDLSSGDRALLTLLDRISLTRLFAVFVDQDVTLELLLEFDAADFKELNLPLGPRKQLTKELERIQSGAASMPEPMEAARFESMIEELYQQLSGGAATPTTLMTTAAASKTQKTPSPMRSDNESDEDDDAEDDDDDGDTRARGSGTTGRVDDRGTEQQQQQQSSPSGGSVDAPPEPTATAPARVASPSGSQQHQQQQHQQPQPPPASASSTSNPTLISTPPVVSSPQPRRMASPATAPSAAAAAAAAAATSPTPGSPSLRRPLAAPVPSPIVATASTPPSSSSSSPSRPHRTLPASGTSSNRVTLVGTAPTRAGIAITATGARLPAPIIAPKPPSDVPPPTAALPPPTAALPPSIAPAASLSSSGSPSASSPSLPRGRATVTSADSPATSLQPPAKPQKRLSASFAAAMSAATSESAHRSFDPLERSRSSPSATSVAPASPSADGTPPEDSPTRPAGRGNINRISQKLNLAQVMVGPPGMGRGIGVPVIRAASSSSSSATSSSTSASSSSSGPARAVGVRVVPGAPPVPSHIQAHILFKPNQRSGELKISRYNTLNEVTSMIHAKFVDESKSTDEILRSFGIMYFSPRNPTGITCSGERLVSSLPDIQSGVTFELVHRTSTPRFIKVKTAGLQSSLTLRIDSDTTALQVVFTVLKKHKDRNAYESLPFKPYSYGLFLTDSAGNKFGSVLEEEQNVMEVLGTKNELLFSPISGNYDGPLELKILNEVSFKCDVCKFDPSMTVRQALVKLLKLNPAQEFTEVGLYQPGTEDEAGFFLDDESTLQSNGLSKSSVLELKKRFRGYSLTLPLGTAVTYKCDEHATVQDCFDFIYFNYAEELPGERTDYCLFVFEGPMLDMKRHLWSIPVPKEGLQLKHRPQALVVFFEGNQVTVDVDYDGCLMTVMPLIFKRLGLKELSPTEYSLIQLGGGSVDPCKPLKSQYLAQNTSVLLKIAEQKLQRSKAKEPVASVNIWDEEESDATIRYDSDVPVKAGELPAIAAATFNKLVDRLTSFEAPDLMYMKAFLLTYRSFATPEQLLCKLIERYHVPAREEQNRTKIQLRVCNTVKYWIENSSTDFDHDLAQQVVDFVDDTLMKNDQWKGSLARQIRSAVLKRTCQMRVALGQGRSVGSAFLVRDSTTLASVGASFDLIDRASEEVLAEQLSLSEFNIYAGIQPTEFLNCCWAKPETEHQAPHVMKLIERFNIVSLWIVHSIVSPMRVRDRAKRWAKAIRIAAHLLRLGNFSTLMAFVSGLSHSALSRLKHTKALVPKAVIKQGQDIEDLMSAESSFKVYRQQLRRVTPPCLPYIGVYLKDLTFIEDGNPDTLSGLINFGKRTLLYKAIADMQQYQLKPYPFRPDPELVALIHDIPKYDENELYNVSLEREPRGADKSSII